MLYSALIVLSLLLLLGLGVAALFLAGGTQDSASMDRTEDDDDE
ncbi:MAG: single-stranded DNA-binding protein [Candidatus Thiodiazotropha sp.]